MSKTMKALKMKRKDIYDAYDTYVHGNDTLKLVGAGGFRWHEDKTGVRCRICSGIAQKEFMDEYDKYLNGEREMP